MLPRVYTPNSANLVISVFITHHIHTQPQLLNARLTLVPNDGITTVTGTQQFSFNKDMLEEKRMMLLQLIQDLSKARESSREKTHQAFTIGTEDTGCCLGTEVPTGCGGFGSGPRAGAVAVGGVTSALAVRQRKSFPQEKKTGFSPFPHHTDFSREGVKRRGKAFILTGLSP